MYSFGNTIENTWQMLFLTADYFLPVGCGLDTLKSMAALVVFSYSQCQWQLYVPSSLSVTLNIDRMNSFLHLVCISFSSTLNLRLFSGKGSGLLFKCQDKYSGQE